MRKIQIFTDAINKFPICINTRSFEYHAINDKILEYKTGSSERNELDAVIKEYSSKVTEVPICIGDEEIKTDEILTQKYPFDHSKVLAKFSYANENLLKKAVKVGLEARYKWERISLKDRAAVFIKASDLISGKYRPHVVATTILGQAKTIFQAEIDAAAETVDFLRFNVQAASEISKYKPLDSPGVVNTMRWRAMEGFWAAISPFNFTAIGCNLASAPAIMGNTVLWKPTDSAMLSNYVMYKILRESGLPPGIINFIPCDGPLFGKTICGNPHLAGINFTGSVKTFRHIWATVGQNINHYNSYPRLIGECGGKNFHFVHESADVDNVAVSTVRSAFEFGGQKCSACSRIYVPETLWPSLKQKMLDILQQVKVDSPLVKDTFMSAVIDHNAYKRITSYIEYAKKSNKLTIEFGGQYDDSKGYFVHPTIISTTDPHDKIMKEEIFGPVLSVFVYPCKSAEKTIELVDSTTPFALTGAVFSKCEKFLAYSEDKLRNSTGNFYVNVQSTGSVVGQQPFGGSRLSGTNDKAGGPHYVLKFVSAQSTKVQTGPISSWKQAHME